MDHLYTPWRMGYLRGEHKNPDVDCIFCDKAKSASLEVDAENFVVARSKYVYVILNIYPYNNGHVMVIPYVHAGSSETLSQDALCDLMVTSNRAMAALRQIYQPQGFNLGANLGAAAGAGIAGHFHMHVVPRWGGDSNFMTVTADTRVIPETLEDTHRKLTEVWPTLE